MRWERGGWAEKQSREVKAPASQGSNKGKEQGKGDTFFTVINEWKIFGTFALDKIAWFSLVCVLQYFQLDLRWCQSVGWWYSTVLDDTALCWMIRHCVGWYGTVLDDTALCWMIRHCVEWYDTVLDDTAYVTFHKLPNCTMPHSRPALKLKVRRVRMLTKLFWPLEGCLLTHLGGIVISTIFACSWVFMVRRVCKEHEKCIVKERHLRSCLYFRERA